MSCGGQSRVRQAQQSNSMLVFYKCTLVCTSPRRPPSAPGEHDMRAAVFPLKALYMGSSFSWGRLIQSNTFFKKGVTLPLYLGNAHTTKS